MDLPHQILLPRLPEAGEVDALRTFLRIPHVPDVLVHKVKTHRRTHPRDRWVVIGPLLLTSYSYPRGGRDLRLLRRFFSHVGEFPAAGSCSPGARDSIARREPGPESVSETRLLIAAPMRDERWSDLGSGLLVIVDWSAGRRVGVAMPMIQPPSR